MKFIENTVESPMKKIYFSDGSAAKHKERKYFLNITCHNDDFGAPAEGHVFSRSHGKSACDGGWWHSKKACSKSQFAVIIYDQIMPPHQLYKWVQSSMHKLNFGFVTEN
jgi:hypothetical protein